MDTPLFIQSGPMVKDSQRRVDRICTTYGLRKGVKSQLNSVHTIEYIQKF